MEKIKLNIKTSKLKLELEGDRKHLFELRKLFSEINKLDSDLEDVNLDDLIPATSVPFWKFTKEIQKNEAAMELIDDVSQAEEGLRVRKISIDNVNEITDKGSTTRIDLEQVKSSMEKLFLNVDLKKTNFVLVHTISNIDDDYCSIINDQIRKNVPHSKTKLLKTKKDIMDKTIVECIFFGNYPCEDLI